MIRIHKENQVLKTGSYCYLAGGYQWLAFGRFNRNEQMVVILNNDDQDKEVQVPVRILGVANDSEMVTIMRTNEDGYYTKMMSYSIERGYVHTTMERYSGLLLKAKTKNKFA